MNEEEIKEAFERLEYFEPDDLIECAMYRNCLEKLQGLLDLYNKEKEKNKPQPDCEEPQERTEEMVNIKWVNYNYISKDKIREKIKELEQKQEDNKKELSKGIDLLSNNIINEASNKISINMTVREILLELLEEE